MNKFIKVVDNLIYSPKIRALASVIIIINDRMGNKTRIIDLTKKGAKKLGFIKKGLAKVKLEKIY